MINLNTFKKVPYPVNMCETELEAIVYNKLRSYGLDARLQVNCGYCSGHRFDIVIFHNKISVCIIEVKATSRKKGYNRREVIQLKEYKDYELPLIVCNGYSKIDKTIKKVLYIMGQFDFDTI
jgi:hypothetical protein